MLLFYANVLFVLAIRYKRVDSCVVLVTLAFLY